MTGVFMPTLRVLRRSLRWLPPQTLYDWLVLTAYRSNSVMPAEDSDNGYYFVTAQSSAEFFVEKGML